MRNKFQTFVDSVIEPEKACKLINLVKDVTGGTYNVEPMGIFSVTVIDESGGVMCMINLPDIDMSLKQKDPKKRPKFIRGSGIRIEGDAELYGGKIDL
jgi:hypothetical protein